MIKLISIKNEEFYLNCDLIYRMDIAHDTIITLIDGKTLRVVDKTEDIVKKIIEFKRKIYTDSMEGVQ